MFVSKFYTLRSDTINSSTYYNKRARFYFICLSDIQELGFTEHQTNKLPDYKVNQNKYVGGSFDSVLHYSFYAFAECKLIETSNQADQVPRIDKCYGIASRKKPYEIQGIITEIKVVLH